MKAYLVKYCLIDGIKEVYGEISGRYFRTVSLSLYTIDKEIYLEKDVAIKKAEAMRVKKITSLKKQIERLEKLKF